MTNKKPIYSKNVIEIADWLFKNTEKKISEEISVFCSKFQKTERTIWSYVKKAQKYNKSRIDKQEKARDEVLVEEAKKAIKLDILSRNERMKILSDIANGKAKKIEGRILVPSSSEQVRAIAELNKMEGDYAPTKIDAVVEQTNSLTPEEAAEIIKEMFYDSGKTNENSGD